MLRALTESKLAFYRSIPVYAHVVLLKVGSGGALFSKIQKFQPDEGNVYEELSNRR
jgi:hypothetical protein